jgi:WD40 repeat protein
VDGGDNTILQVERHFSSLFLVAAAGRARNTGEYRSLPDGLLAFQNSFSPDSRRLALVERSGEREFATAVKLFDVATGEQRLSISNTFEESYVQSLGFSPDGRLLIGAVSKILATEAGLVSQAYLKLWDASSGDELASFKSPALRGLHWQITADGNTLAAASWDKENSRLMLIDLPSRKLRRAINLGANVSVAGAFSADGKWLALSTQQQLDLDDAYVEDLPQPRIHLIDVESGETRETLATPQGYAALPCFSPDGKTLATPGYGKVLLWDLTRPPGAAADK